MSCASHSYSTDEDLLWAMVRAFYGFKTDAEMVEHFNYSLELHVAKMCEAVKVLESRLSGPSSPDWNSALYKEIINAAPQEPGLGDGDFLLRVCDELFGCFINGGHGGSAYHCGICEIEIDVHNWIIAPHRHECIVPLVRDYLAKHMPGRVPGYVGGNK